MTIKCVTFDLDDTLWEIHPVIANAENRFYRWLQENLPRVSDNHSHDDLRFERVQYFEDNPHLHHDLSQLRKNWMIDVAGRHGYKDSLLDEGFAVFWKERNNVTLFDKAQEVLSFTNNNFTTGAITNGNADIHHIGIGDYFDFFLTSADVGNSKPHPAIFEAAVNQADCAPENILHVGDDPERDVEGAARAGMKTVWVNTLDQVWEGGVLPDAEINTISELTAVLQRFLES